jgi:adenosylmethionine-8-amino-7-oxononanoate aminotransferase
VQNAAVLGKQLSARLNELLFDHPNVGDIRGRGLFWGIELVADKATKKPFPAAQTVAANIVDHGLQEPYCIAVYPGSGTVDGVNGDHIIISPPFNSTAAEIDDIVTRFHKLITDYFNTGSPNINGRH